MGRFASLFTIVALSACCLVAAGCAGTARGLQHSVYQHDGALGLIDTSRSEADALVVIRYPAMVHEDAEAAYFSSFEQHPIGGSYKADALTGQESDRIALSLVAKANYFAMSLYRELRDRLRPDAVLLSPHMIEVDDQGALVSRPILSTEEIPSVLTVDFSVYSHPDPRKMMDAEPQTFGDLVTPLFVVHANRWLRPSTHGLLLSSEPLLGAAWAQSGRQAAAQVRARFEDRPASWQRPLDFIAYLDHGERETGGMPRKAPGETRAAVLAVEAYPLEKIQMDGERMARLPADPAVDPFAEDFAAGAATRVVEALNRIDHDRATFFTRQTALARFDPQLAGAFLSRSQSEDTRARLQMAEALIAAERKFIANQSASLYSGAFEGDYGAQMRQMLAAEYRLLEERRDLARAQNLSTALAVVALAGAMYIGSATDGSDFFESPTMEHLLVLSSLWSVNRAISARAQSKTIGENFLAQMAPAIDRQVTVQVEWLQSREQITARNFTEFRAKTLALYQRSVRSLQSEPKPGCVFRHPALDTDGRWYGACADGLAEGSGYGVVAGTDGYLLEYAGVARAGLADGSGAMIFRSPADTAPVFFEGGFREGLPDGVVRIEKAGSKPRVRRFDRGSERGSADADELQRLRF